MSAPDAANRDRNASGIWSRKSDIDGWSRTLGQIATYIATSRTSATDQPSRLRRWSHAVLVRTSRSIRPTPGVEGQERLLEVGLGALEVIDAVLGDPLDQSVEGLLGSAAGHHVPLGHPQVADTGNPLEVRRRDLVQEGGPHPVQGLRREHLQLLNRHQAP